MPQGFRRFLFDPETKSPLPSIRLQRRFGNRSVRSYSALRGPFWVSESAYWARSLSANFNEAKLLHIKLYIQYGVWNTKLLNWTGRVTFYINTCAICTNFLDKNKISMKLFNSHRLLLIFKFRIRQDINSEDMKISTWKMLVCGENSLRLFCAQWA